MIRKDKVFNTKLGGYFMIKQHSVQSEKERQIAINLSESDCNYLIYLCGEVGISIGDLIETFLCDLISNEKAQGSDESKLVRDWFDKCDFSRLPNNYLLSHLIETEYNPKEYVEYLELIEECEQDKEYFQSHPDEIDEEERELVEADIESWNEKLNEMKDGWHPGRITDMDKEHEIISEWIKNKENLLAGKLWR